MATTLFELLVKIGLDSNEYESGISKLSSGIKTFANGVGVAMGAASTAAVAVGKQALDAYADYEQLVGGVDTLFKDSSAKVQEYAANAFQTAGLSANAYMETVTSFSASLLQSLDKDTVAAADVANRAITDMSDNANRMGTDMQMIQNAYQGFAKGNYTMLDNLRIGYGGTKTEMERLLADAEKLSGMDFDISSYADVIEAIHVIQTDMGITGTTAAEAAQTISGSTAAMKAAWQNLLVGISDDTQDFDGLIENLVNSVSTVADNVLPRIEVIFGGLGQLVEQLFPKIVEQIPVLVSEGLPKLVALATTLIKTLVDGLKKNSKQLASGATEIITTLVNGIAEMLPDVVELGLDLLVALAEGVADNIDKVLDTVVDVVLQIVDLLTNPETLVSLVDAGLEIVTKLIEGVIKALPKIAKAVPKIITNIVKAVPEIVQGIIDTLLSPEMTGDLISAGIELFRSIIGDLPAIISALVEAIPDIIDSLCKHFTDPQHLAQLMRVGEELFVALLESVPIVVDSALSLVDGLFGTHIASWYNQVTDFFMEFGSQLYQMTNQNVLSEQELYAKYSNMQSELSAAAVEALKNGMTVEQAYVEAMRQVLDTTEELYAFDVLSQSKNFGINFSTDDIAQWERNLATAAYSQNSAQYYEMMGKERLEKAQPLIVTFQMPSGVEMGRQYIEDINTAKRVDGAAYG